MLNRDQLTAMIMSLFIWGFAGALFGSLFAGLYQVLQILDFPGAYPMILAATAAAMTTTAFYSAMPVALIGAMAGVLSSISYLIASNHDIHFTMITGIAATAGVIAGSFHSWVSSATSRPLAITFTGLLAGFLTGMLLAVILALSGIQTSMFWLAAAVVAMVGSLFQISKQWILIRFSGGLPGSFSAPIVAGLIASVVGASIWLMGGTTATVIDTQPRDVLSLILHDIPPGLLGGLLGGVAAGFLLELFGFHLEEH